MILILNHPTKNCGVHQFGRRIADLLLQSKVLSVVYREINTAIDYNSLLDALKPRIVIANWYPITMGWLSDNLLRPTIKNYFLFHDGHMRGKFDKIIFCGNYEKPDAIRYTDDQKMLLPRPLLKYDGDYPVNSVPNIGSFGFGFWHKGFNDIVTKVNNEFSEAVINLHMPYAHFGDESGIQAREVAERCRENNKNPNITLNITSDLKSEEQILDFLAKNDINAFMYGGVSEGISSVLDYALSVRRPIALTNNMMFRHILSDDNIITDDNTIGKILDKGVAPLERFYTEWSIENFIQRAEELLHG